MKRAKITALVNHFLNGLLDDSDCDGFLSYSALPLGTMFVVFGYKNVCEGSSYEGDVIIREKYRRPLFRERFIYL